MDPPTPESLNLTNTPIQDSDTTNKDYAHTQDLLYGITRPLKDFTVALDGLQGQTMQIALLGAQMGTRQEITDFRDRMRDQNQRHKDGVEEIQAILDELLETHVVDSMRQQVEQEIANQIDHMVKESIAECLQAHIPRHLQMEVADGKRELERIRLALHNSESRRLNGNLRSNKPDELLGTMYMRNGIISPRYPKDLKALFNLDANLLKSLFVEYELPNCSESKEFNLNRFMQFCGVKYQLVE